MTHFADIEHHAGNPFFIEPTDGTDTIPLREAFVHLALYTIGDSDTSAYFEVTQYDKNGSLKSIDTDRNTL